MAHVGVVLVNLGTPTEPTLPAVRRFLREFLSDRRIVPLHPICWRPILELWVLGVYARGSTARYASVWTPEGSPLLVHTKAQVAALARELGDCVRVDYAMRYGSPTLGSVTDRLRSEGVERVLVVPAYPQYSATTTATVLDVLAAHMRSRVDQPGYRVLRDFHADPGYVDACAARIEETWAAEGRPDFAAGDRLLLSYHGLPVSMVAAGDPYPRECETTTAAIRRRLALSEQECLMAYQSKFGRGEWLTPATVDTVAGLGRSGVRRLDVFCPGFLADCVETEEEIGILNRREFLAAGGDRFVRVPCLNDAPTWVAALADLVRRELAGWACPEACER